jgi:hypothetical protein
MTGNPFLQQMGKEIPDKKKKKKKSPFTDAQQGAIQRRLAGGKGSGRN